MGELVTAVRSALADAGDPVQAERMRAYMKSAMPYRGVPSPVRTRLTRPLFAQHPMADRDTWLAAVLTLWREAGYREERYVAIDLAGHRPYLRWHAPGLLPAYREMIVGGAWWDYVDEIAARHIGPLLAAHRAEVTPVVRGWATDHDLWLRRTSVICQLKAKADTDLDLLTYSIESTLDDKDFFLRKGIGWALRQYARTDPDWVREFVRTHPGLSPLSRREATRHL
ncbi:MAG TPA: DNA alkylation repair protein [Pseudonocardiaceae bacterium]|nr:DNA alkylation repair protein [Pseudonocardiaceae bacterium]